MTEPATDDFYQRSVSLHQRTVERMRQVGAVTLLAVDAAQRRSRRTSGVYPGHARAALSLVDLAGRIEGGFYTFSETQDPDAIATAWLVFLVQVGVVADEWGLAIGPLLELADRWSIGERQPLTMAASMVDLATAMNQDQAAYEDQATLRPAVFQALALTTAAAIVSMRRQLDDHGMPATTAKQYVAAVEFTKYAQDAGEPLTDP